MEGRTRFETNFTLIPRCCGILMTSHISNLSFVTWRHYSALTYNFHFLTLIPVCVDDILQNLFFFFILDKLLIGMLAGINFINYDVIIETKCKVRC